MSFSSSVFDDLNKEETVPLWSNQEIPLDNIFLPPSLSQAPDSGEFTSGLHPPRIHRRRLQKFTDCGKYAICLLIKFLFERGADKKNLEMLAEKAKADAEKAKADAEKAEAEAEKAKAKAENAKDDAKDETDEIKFEKLCEKAKAGETKNVLAAVDNDKKLINRVDRRKYTLLHHACCCEYAAPLLVKGLLERGADVNAFSRCGWVPLMFSSQKGDIESCIVLLDYGANPNFTNYHRSPLTLAAERDYLEVCLLLISRGAKLIINMYYGGDALKIYGQYGNPKFGCGYGSRHWKCKLTPSELKQRRNTLSVAFANVKSGSISGDPLK